VLVWLVLTSAGVTVKVAEVVPAGTVTLAGTLAAALLLVRATSTPPAGATAFKVTFPLALWHGLFKVVGLKTRALSAGG
jgi:hypothetical protein